MSVGTGHCDLSHVVLLHGVKHQHLVTNLCYCDAFSVKYFCDQMPLSV